ncbi:zona pellucida-like domain-containing protein 1 [Nothobranchius furzeri]|uniref:zona pellucida-like domain-containing protein 1 n=1 Tax=Nothobranchius furzeri TaxID=105023 RepID=UPI00240406E3|nr:zona pellucida-like domain-containing protein 1 [Nothobranchius furzeri]
MKFVLLFLSFVVRSGQLPVSNCGTEARQPDIRDIVVNCGTSSISLEIQICPVLYSGSNESHLVLNNMLEPSCRATLDESVTPPVARFDFPVNMTDTCSTIQTVSVPGIGPFPDFSNMWMNISGVVRPINSSKDNITNSEELEIFYSCVYPLQDLVRNTQIHASASSITSKDNNETFIHSLSMVLFADAKYTQLMVIPELGIKLRTDIYVEVKATNLTDQYHVLLDRCYASTSPLPSISTFFNLFVSCSVDYFTTIIENGVSQNARFKFQAFHFIEHQNEKVSTYYLHCITRLCETSACGAFKQCNSRRKRSTSDSSTAPNAYTVTSPQIITKTDTSEFSEKPLAVGGGNISAVRLGLAAGFLACAGVFALGVVSVIYRRLRN